VQEFGSNDHQIILGDCQAAMSEMDAGSIDCIITDPAYWTLDKWRNIGTTTRLGGHREREKQRGWFETLTPDELYECLCEFYRLLPKNGHAWVMCDGETLGYILGYLREGYVGFKYFKPYPVIKMRYDGLGIKQGLGYHGRASHEYIVLCEKGRRRFTGENWPDVFQVSWTGDKESKQFTPDGKSYSTAKPLSFFKRLIELSSSFGETVLDPFAGSGTLAEAAQQTGRNSISIDCSEHSIKTIRNRLTFPTTNQTQILAANVQSATQTLGG
jgi:site-specific DNA-methyltransferase (adenine-specific)